MAHQNLPDAVVELLLVLQGGGVRVVEGVVPQEGLHGSGGRLKGHPEVN